jgi:hypothetical protein
MANRSDRRSALPRQTKRMLSLTSVGNVHHDGEVRRLMIAAHKQELAAKDKKRNPVELEVDGNPKVNVA